MIESGCFHYIFGFVFDPLPLARDVAVPGQTGSWGEYIRGQLSEKHSDHYLAEGIAFHLSEEDESRESRCAMYMRFPHLSITTKPVAIEVSGLGPARLNSHLALFESGLGMMWVTIDIGGPLDQDAVAKMLTRGSFPGLATRVDDHVQRKSVYEVAFEETESLRLRISEAISSGKAGDGAGDDAPARTERGRKVELRWIERELNVVWTDPLSGEEAEMTPHGITQEPFVAAILRLPPPDLAQLDVAKGTAAKLPAVVMGLLHGIPHAHLDASHLRAEHRGGLQNLYPDNRFRTYVHCNRLVVFHAEGHNSSELRLFSKGLFRTFVAVRGCWHFYSVTNELLDLETDKLYTQFLDDVSTHTTAVNDMSDRLLFKRQEVIEAKGGFLRCLAVEDPLVRAVGMTPFAGVYHTCASDMELVELKELVKYKLDGLNALFDMVNAYLVRSSYRQTVGQTRDRVFPGVLLVAIILLLVGATCVVLPAYVPTVPPFVSFVGMVCLGLGVLVDVLMISALAVIGWRPGMRRKKEVEGRA